MTRVEIDWLYPTVHVRVQVLGNLLPTQSCLVSYSFCANLLHSLIMWLTVSSLSPHSLHLLFCCVLSIPALIWLVFMALFCASIRRDSVSLLKFPFLSHFQVFSCETVETFKNFFYDNAWPHIMTMLGSHAAETHWLGILDFTLSTIFFWSLTLWLSFFYTTLFDTKKTFHSKEKVRTVFKDFFTSKLLEFYQIGINSLVNWWQKCGDIQGSYSDWLK